MNFTTFILSAIMLSAAIPSHSQLLQAKDISQKKADEFIRSMPKTELEKYFTEHSVDFKRPDGSYDVQSFDFFVPGESYAWNFRGEIYYSHFQKFRSNVDPSPSCDISNPQNDCMEAIRGFNQCHLLIFDSERKLAAAKPLSIAHPKYMIGKPNCDGPVAIAPAIQVKEAFIVILGYHDSRGFCRSLVDPEIVIQPQLMCRESSAPDAPIDVLFETALLIRIGKDVEGKISLTQDDRCLSRLNRYATVASARKALRERGCH